MSTPEPPRSVGAGLLKRGAICGLLIVLLAAGSVSAAGFLQADTLINTIEKEGRAPINIPEIDRAQAGEAQTLMILGSDQRFGDKKLGIKPRSDTIILVRLDPDKEATAVMSIPRDLKVDIPGYDNDRINAAYELGGPRLTVKTVKKLFANARRAVQDQPHHPGRLRRLPQGRQLHRRRLRRHRPRLLQRQLGRRELRHDRRQPGLPEAQGPGRARLRPLPPRRQRPRARARASRTSCASCATPRAPASCSTTGAGASSRRSSPATPTPTRACGARRTSSRLLKLVLFTGRKPVREVRFRVDLDRRPGLPDGLQGQARQDRQRVPQRPGVEEAAPDLDAPPTTDRETAAAARRASATAPPTCPGSRSPGARARTRRSSARGGAKLPVLLPDAAHPGRALRGHRAAHLPHPRRARQAAPRLPARRLQGPRSASTTGSRARPGASRRSSTTRRRPARSTAASSSCTTTAAGCGWSRGGRSARSTGSPTR